MNEAKIVVVEDEPSLVETLAYSLRKQGYTLFTAGDGRRALEVARQQQPDLVVLDVMLPGLDGFEVCRILRREMNVPILMLTARSEEIDKIVGLEVGAKRGVAEVVAVEEVRVVHAAAFVKEFGGQERIVAVTFEGPLGVFLAWGSAVPGRLGHGRHAVAGSEGEWF